MMLESLIKTLGSAFDATTSMDISNRFYMLAKPMFEDILRHVAPSEWPAVAGIKAHISSVLSNCWSHSKENHILHGSPDPYIGRANLYHLHYPRYVLDRVKHTSFHQIDVCSSALKSRRRKDGTCRSDQVAYCWATTEFIGRCPRSLDPSARNKRRS